MRNSELTLLLASYKGNSIPYKSKVLPVMHLVSDSYAKFFQAMSV